MNCNKPSEINQKQVFVACIDFKKDRLNFREALVLAQQGMRKFPYSYHLRLNKALLLESLGNSRAAEKELIGLIYLYPNRQELHNYLGRIFYETNKSKALLALLSSIALDPDNEIGQENLIFVKRLLDRNPLREKPSVNRSSLTSFQIDDFEIINQRLSRLSKNKTTAASKLEDRLGLFFETLNNYKHRKEGFFWEFYAPHYINIYKKNLTKDFANYISENQNGKRSAQMKFDFGTK
ncbi:hypothetical protein GO491_08760 [Flavobacteriaceae bacterium Ap0902]|nr:hypothetical protein [Flavobacteriaceae bacterium Ap0902]